MRKWLAARLYFSLKRLRWWLLLDVVGEMGRPGHDEALLLRWQDRLIEYAPDECAKLYSRRTEKERGSLQQD